MKPRQTRAVPIALMVGLLLVATVVYAGDSDNTWTDPANGLTWATQDNGTDVHWRQANTYCADLRLGGYSNWRLPTIEELATMYDAGEVSTCGLSECNIKPGITLSSSVEWSSSPGKASGEAWVFDFSSGRPASLIRIVSISKRALCVRSSRK